VDDPESPKVRLPRSLKRTKSKSAWPSGLTWFTMPCASKGKTSRYNVFEVLHGGDVLWHKEAADLEEARKLAQERPPGRRKRFLFLTKRHRQKCSWMPLAFTKRQSLSRLFEIRNRFRVREPCYMAQWVLVCPLCKKDFRLGKQAARASESSSFPLGLSFRSMDWRHAVRTVGTIASTTVLMCAPA
jgi:hypothetical protein